MMPRAASGEIVFGSPFPVPAFRTLQPTPLLRSWFLDTADRPEHPRVLADLRTLLTRLDPRAARRMRNQSARLVYLAILKWCAARFPINNYVLHSIEFEWDEDETDGMYDMLPVEPCGFNFDDWMPPALAVCGLLSLWDIFQDDFQAGVDLLQQHKWLREYAPPARARETTTASSYLASYREPPKLPRGRMWRKPWHALRDAVDYATSRTGIAFLDYDSASLEEQGSDAYPRLTFDEIRASVEGWSKARVMLRGINAFTDYIGKNRARMKLLADVLARRPGAIQQVTLPKRT